MVSIGKDSFVKHLTSMYKLQNCKYAEMSNDIYSIVLVRCLCFRCPVPKFPTVLTTAMRIIDKDLVSGQCTQYSQ